MSGFLAALQFLTRFPVNADRVSAAGSLPWYPVVGLVLGVFATVLGGLLSAGAQASVVAGAVYVAALAAVTGALHLDGLADTADAWVGGQGDRERTLAIMKDTACGAMGVTAIVTVLIVKSAAATALFVHGATLPLLIAPALGRATAGALLLGLPYVRPGGLGQGMVTDMPRQRVRWSLMATAAIALLFTPLAFVASLIALVTVAAALRRRLGGVTGDAAGAGIELAETAALLGASLTF